MKPKKSKRDGLYQRGDTWYFRRMVGDKRVAVSTECKDRRQAERRKTELDLDMNNGVFGWKKDTKTVPTIAEYLSIAQAVYESQSEGERAIKRLTALAAAFPSRAMDTFTLTDCQTYIAGRMRFGLAQNSARAEHIVFKAFWNRAIGDKLIPADNPWRFPAPKAVARTRVLSYAEQVHLWAIVPDHVRRVLTVITLTGLRSAEVRGIELKDVDFDRKQITVRADIAKGKKARVVPMPDEAAQAIREQLADFATGNLARHFRRYRAGEPRLFPYATNGIINALRVTDAATLTVHDLRRTFGTRCAEAGVPMTVLKEWMGHASITITAQFYTHIDAGQASFVNRVVEATAKAIAAVTPTAPAKILPMVKG